MYKRQVETQGRDRLPLRCRRCVVVSWPWLCPPALVRPRTPPRPPFQRAVILLRRGAETEMLDMIVRNGKPGAPLVPRCQVFPFRSIPLLLRRAGLDPLAGSRKGGPVGLVLTSFNLAGHGPFGVREPVGGAARGAAPRLTGPGTDCCGTGASGAGCWWAAGGGGAAHPAGIDVVDRGRAPGMDRGRRRATGLGVGSGTSPGTARGEHPGGG